MTKRIRYDGTVAIFVTTIIPGSNERWRPGQSQEVSESDAALLLASGKGFADITNMGGVAASVDAPTMSSALSATDAAGRAAFRAASGAVTYTPVANEAAMLGITVPLRVGDAVNRTDTGTTWRYIGPGLQTLLASWRNEGSGNAATSKTLAPGATLTHVAEAGGPTGDYNRPLACPGGALTCGGSPVLNDMASVLNTHASTALTLTGSGVTVTAAAGKIAELVYNGTAWVDPSIAQNSGTSLQRLVPSQGAIPNNDAASASTAETVVLEGLLPALGMNSLFWLDIAFSTPSAGTGTSTYRLRLGGTIGGGISGTSTVDSSGALAECGRWRLGFTNYGDATKQVGGIVTGAVYGAASRAGGAYATSIDTSAAGIRWVLTIQKQVASDVKQLLAASPLVVL